MEVIKKENEWLVLLAILVIAVILLVMGLEGCTTASCVYKVKFESGDVEYYELNYKPKKNATSIEYNGETILGVKSLERIK